MEDEISPLQSTVERSKGIGQLDIIDTKELDGTVCRDSNGRLLPGSRLNPGGRNRHEPIEAGLLRHLVKLTGDGQTRYEAMLDRLTLDACAGDKDSRELVLAYLHGKPVVRQEVTGANGGALEVNHQTLLLAKVEQMVSNNHEV